jgi:hypothetical protein
MAAFCLPSCPRRRIPAEIAPFVGGTGTPGEMRGVRRGLCLETRDTPVSKAVPRRPRPLPLYLLLACGGTGNAHNEADVN